ncbi:alpha/beta fold hydrolase [Streptomyces sp. DSM 42041]|uniref:Alpha/beta fold hydrolase n=1 Tax=Streptomyces hazeniae TaxID=3075538 RepID=A0ABU2P048_9ACTN|nr:alpha/beta fold hydrolase [Streptomyces sp. DSM 42041]MDT0382614.1 alpha/beta fold hydrolase [Streptomyces sp. DSM 42041]
MRFPRQLASAVFAPAPLSRSRALAVSERLAAATTLTSSLEYLTQHRERGPGGFNDWEVVKDGQAGSAPLTRRLLDLVSGERTTTALHVARAAVSAGMMLPGGARRRGLGNLFLGASTALLYPRHRYGTDGSDQVSTLVQAATGVARLSGSTAVQDAALWYMALQSNLSYVVSGWVKLLGESWRDASALPGVMRTRTYGCEPAFRLAQKHPVPARYLTHGVLALECLFPVAYLFGGRLTRPVLAGAGAFHLTNGFAMGLGRFVTSFTAMHPAVAYTATPKTHPAVAGRDDRMLKVVGGALALAAAGAGATAVQRRLRVREGWPTSAHVTTRAGNRLQYEIMSHGAADKPFVLFCAGLGTTSEQWGWITESLARETDYGVLTYARAGYAGSDYRSADPYRLTESVDDLVDLVRGAVPEGRTVLLVGHSLGGELCRRAAVRLGDRTHGVVYLDSAHPMELNRSAQQSKSARLLPESLHLMDWSLRIGLGALISRPDWLRELPQNYQSRAFAQYADARAWKAARREWAAVEEDFRAQDGDLDAIDAHALVISAQRTTDRDPEQLLMHNELGRAHEGPGNRVESLVVEDADHGALLMSSRHGLRVAARIVDFLDATTGGRKPSASGRDRVQKTVKGRKP